MYNKNDIVFDLNSGRVVSISHFSICDGERLYCTKADGFLGESTADELHSLDQTTVEGKHNAALVAEVARLLFQLK